MLKTYLAATATAALFAGAASAQDMMMTDPDAMQMSMADGQTVVTFPLITAQQDGYIVLHAVENGEPVVPASLGHAMVMAGENADVVVSIPGALEAGTELIAMLHAETNGNGVYDFGEGMTDVDTPVLVNGAPVTASFVVPEGMVMMEAGAAEPVSPGVQDPEERAASDEEEDPDYREETSDPEGDNDTEVEGEPFGEEEDAKDGEVEG